MLASTGPASTAAAPAAAAAASLFAPGRAQIRGLGRRSVPRDAAADGASAVAVRPVRGVGRGVCVPHMWRQNRIADGVARQRVGVKGRVIAASLSPCQPIKNVHATGMPHDPVASTKREQRQRRAQLRDYAFRIFVREDGRCSM